MADSVTVGDLLVRIGANVDSLVDAAKKGTKALQDMDVSGSRVSAGIMVSSSLIASAIGAMVSSLEKSISAAINRLADLGKTSQQIGVPVEALSQLEFAAKKAGVSADDLAQGIKLFSRNAGEVRSALEPADAFSLAMRNMQVNLNDANGRVRDTSSLILDLSDKFSRMPDGVQKTRMAMELFGRSGADMIPFLNQGRQKIQEYMDQSDKFGATVGKSNTEAALRFNNAISSINGVFDNIVKKLLGDFLPTMEGLATMLNNTIKSTDNMSLATEGLRITFGALVTAGTLVVGTFKQILELAGGMAQTIKAVFSGDWQAAWDAAKNTVVTSLNTMDQTFRAAIGQWSPASVGIKTALAGVVAASTWAASTTVEAFKPVEQTLKQSAEAHARLRAEFVNGLVLTPGPTVFAVQSIEAALAKGKITLDEYDVAMTKAIGAHHIDELGKLEDVMDKATSTMQEKLAALETAWRGMSITTRQYGKDVRDVEKQNQQNMLDTASLASSTLTTMFKDNKSAAIGAAVINTAVGITRTFRDVPWPLNWVQAGLIAASGAAQVSQISSASQGGGSSTASVGAGAAAAPAAAPAAQPETRQLIAQGFSPNQFFSGDTVKGIAKALVDFQRDGGTVVLK